jgi:putative ABC transport system substrate-binding protein
VRRRDVVTLLGGAALAWPLAGARAQPPERMRRIGVLMGIAQSDLNAPPRIQAFQEGLAKLGWTEGHNIRIDIRWAAGDAERARISAIELVGMAPDVLVANALPMLQAVRRETSTIPIIFVQMPDPVGTGAVSNLAKPEGNVTGFTSFEFAMSSKWLELLKEIAPSVKRVAFIFNPVTAAGSETFYLKSIAAAAPSFAVESTAALVRQANEIDGAIAALGGEPAGGLIVMPDLFTSIHHDRIIAMAARHRVPAVYPYRFFPHAGGLISYGIDNVDLYRRAASYVDRILRGATPAELPVQQPTKYEMIINLKTAAAFGITMPVSVLVRADEVIE